MSAPFSACANIAFDRDLGTVRAGAITVQAARILVNVLEPGADEETAVPDANSVGLRVARRVRCALNDPDAHDCVVKVAGVAASVQWLMTAAAGGSISADRAGPWQRWCFQHTCACRRRRSRRRSLARPNEKNTLPRRVASRSLTMRRIHRRSASKCTIAPCPRQTVMLRSRSASVRSSLGHVFLESLRSLA